MIIRFGSFIFNLYRHSIPIKQRLFLKKLFKFFYYRYRFIKLKIYLNLSNENVNLILGAALTKQKGWFSTNEEWLDIVQQSHWERLFNSNKKRVKRVFAEHVFEHLSLDEMRNALNFIYKNMVYGGSLRIAVPDGNNPNEEYRKHCGINGIGADASDHKQFITFELISYEAQKIGFKCNLIEGYLKNKELITSPLDRNLGDVIRTRSRSKKNIINHKEGWDFDDSSSSLIVDCFKLG